MAGFGAIFNNPFGGQNVKPKSANNTAKPFIASYADITGAEDADIIEATVLKSYTQNSQNNPGRRNSGFFTQDSFSKFSSNVANNAAQASVSNGAWMPNRLSGNDFKSGSLSSFRSSNRELGRELANA